MIRKINNFRSMLIILMIIPIMLFLFGIAMSADNTQIIIDGNLKPGMTLKDAIALIGAPDSIKVSDSGTVIMPYDSLGLSLEAMSTGTVIEAIHVKSAFKGKFLSGFEIGADSKEILSAYDQPDIMTKEIIEYSDRATTFQIRQGKLVGADLYVGESTVSHEDSSIESGAYVAEKKEKYSDEIAESYEDNETETAEDEEIAEYEDEEVVKKVTEEAESDEDEEVEAYGKYDVFDLYGFKVKGRGSKIIITEIRPGSVAENGGLKVGEPIRKASYKGLSSRNVYTAGGLKSILKRAVNKGKKYVNILQEEHYYHRVKVPKRN